MKKLIFILTLLIQVSLSFGQTLYNQNSIYLGYSKEKFNTVEFEGETYDQYEVTIIFRNDNPTKYLHEPRVCQVRFLPDIKHPSSNSEIDFAQNGEAYGYVEYTDGTPLPENLNSPKEEDKYGRVISRMIIEPKQENKCRKYILIKSGSEFPEPNYSLDFDNQIPVFVNGSTSLVATWVNRQAKGISLDNVSSWPMIIRKPFDGTNCGGSKPIGNRGEMAFKNSNALNEMKQYLHSTVGTSDNSLLNKIKEIFENAGYKYERLIAEDLEFDGYIYKFDKIKVNVFEDGVDRGFYIDFISNEELLKFKKLNESHLQGVQVVNFDAETFRLTYSYKK